MRLYVALTAMFCVLVVVVWFGLSDFVTADSISGSKTGTLSMRKHHEAMETLRDRWTKAKGAVERGKFEAAAREVRVSDLPVHDHVRMVG